MDKVADMDDKGKFPFPNFTEFKRACADGDSQTVANTAVVGEWLAGRWDSKPSVWVRTRQLTLQYVHVLALFALLLYGALNGNWLIFSVLPLSVLVRISLIPIASKPNRLLRLLIMSVLLGCLFWAVAARDADRALIMGVLVLSWLAQKFEFEFGVKSFFDSIFKDEQFCRAAWLQNAIAVRLTDKGADTDRSRFLLENASDSASGLIKVTGTLNKDDAVEIRLQTAHPLQFTTSDQKIEEADPEIVRKVELRAMKIVMEHEKSQGRKAEDVSMYFTGYDIRSADAERSSTRAIEVKGKSGEGGIILTSNEWKTAAAMGEDYFLYIVEKVYSNRPRIKIIQNPYRRLQPSIKKLQYVMSRRTYVSKADASIEIRRVNTKT